MNEIVIALISAAATVTVGVLSVLGGVISNRNAKKEMMQELAISRAVTDTKIEELTREVREHNNFAKRMPVVENEITHIVEDIHELQSFHK